VCVPAGAAAAAAAAAAAGRGGAGGGDGPVQPHLPVSRGLLPLAVSTVLGLFAAQVKRVPRAKLPVSNDFVELLHCKLAVAVDSTQVDSGSDTGVAAGSGINRAT
jgi:hypothetical protein